MVEHGAEAAAEVDISLLVEEDHLDVRVSSVVAALDAVAQKAHNSLAVDDGLKGLPYQSWVCHMALLCPDTGNSSGDVRYVVSRFSRARKVRATEQGSKVLHVGGFLLCSLPERSNVIRGVTSLCSTALRPSNDFAINAMESLARYLRCLVVVPPDLRAGMYLVVASFDDGIPENNAPKSF